MNSKERHNKIVKEALEREIEVIWAKSHKDVKMEGVHLVEPTYLQIIDGLHTAIQHGVTLVIVHSELTWPYLRPKKHNNS